MPRHPALARSGIRPDVHYQPVVDLFTGATVGFEALLRGTIDGAPAGPRSLLRVLRAEGVDVPALVLERVSADLAAWDLISDRRPSVAVNVDATDLEVSAIVESLDEVMAFLAPDRLVLEVTEIESVETGRATRILEHARSLGVRLALDDFGVGESTLRQFERVQPDIIKIDRSFVQVIADPSADHAMVDVTLALARAAGLEVIAEGIETVAQLVAMRLRGCRHAQGFLFAQAMPADRVESLLLGAGPDAAVDLPLLTSVAASSRISGSG